MIEPGFMCVCDRCGKKEFYINRPTAYPAGWAVILESKDLCPDCYNTYLRTIDNFFRYAAKVEEE